MNLIIKLAAGLSAIASAISCGGAGAMFEEGEAFGISAANYGNAPIENKWVGGVDGNIHQYDGHAFTRPFRGAKPVFANTSTLQDNKQRIPDKVGVRWQDYPGDGKPSYTGKLNGPYVVEIRPKIPKEVLRYATKRFYSIQIGLGINDGPITMNWALHRLPQSPGEQGYLCVGGDFFVASGQPTFDGLSFAVGAKPVGVWPNCKLP
jgi:hypothetical protein